MKLSSRELAASAFLLSATLIASAEPSKSHPPLRTVPPPANRPLPNQNVYFVDPAKGDDKQDGKKSSPWKTLTHALTRLKAGDTLCLRGGVYHERAYVALRGKADAPITIRSAPGERAIIDAGYAEFVDSPADAWEPFPTGGAGEFRSTRTYPNVRDVIGSFADSMIGLQTYYHAIDLRATGELVEWEDGKKQDESDIKPLYCGPGMWLDHATGRIHIRLAHTHNPDPMPNYRGETDPRKLPFVIAPFNAVALHADGAEHVRFEDLIIRGGGYTAVQLDMCKQLKFDNVTIWCGTYGIRANGVVGMKFLNSGLYGNAAPWTFRSDTSKRDYPGRPHRNLTRLNTHALLELDNGRESSVFATPQNDHWEFAHSEFTDAHDGVYLGGINCTFHHNLVENMQDDGIYLSPMYFRHKLDKTEPEIHIYQNVVRQVLTPLAFGGTETVTRDKVFVYRNIFDLRQPIAAGRPTTKSPELRFNTGKPIGDHGSPPWPEMSIYQNTFVLAEQHRDAAMATVGSTRAGNPRRVFNNIFFHLGKLPGYVPPVSANGAIEDGNFFWAPGADAKLSHTFFQKYRSSPDFAESKKLYGPGSGTNSQVANPKFSRADSEARVVNDYRLTDGSAAIAAGIVLPADLKDPYRLDMKKQPDVGAIPHGELPFVVGRKR